MHQDSLHVQLLGGFRVTLNGQATPASAWRLRSAALLVKALALAPGYRLHREQLMELLWPELDTASAANNLRYSLHIARRVLTEHCASGPSVLVRDGESLVLGDPVWTTTDLCKFEAAVDRVWSNPDVHGFRAAAALYTGDLLPEDRYEEWIENRRTAARTSYLALLGQLAFLEEDAGNVSAAIATLQRILALEPADERAHADLMRLFALAGDRRTALAQYEQLVTVLANELDAVPDEPTRDLAEAIRAGDFTLSPGVRGQPQTNAVTPLPSNLPAPVTEMIGREREIAEVVQFLSTHRLVTLTGTGGVGKTTLAEAAGHAAQEQFFDGAFIVSLAEVGQADLVVAAITRTLSVQEQSGATILDSLQSFLRAKRMLLVLDNFEHLLDAAPVVSDLLRSCPHVRVLATSRVRLRLRGEQVYLVQPLAVPTPAMRDADAIAQVASVRLFIERALEAEPALLVDREAVDNIAIACRRLDGIPLAIELAAAWVSAMPLNHLIHRLSQSFDLLQDGPRDVPERQRTLLAAIGWSYDLLTAGEQRVFRRLSTFSGGWDFEAADAVSEVCGEPLSAILQRLAEHHLVVRSQGPGGDIRYSMLETIREFGRDAAKAEGEVSRAQELHARYFGDFVRQAEPELNGPKQGAWLDRLEQEHANLRIALGWALLHQTDLALEMGGRLWRFWFLRGHLSEGRWWLEKALDSSQPEDTSVRARACNVAGILAIDMGDYSAADVLLHEAVSICSFLEDSRGIARATNNLGELAAVQNLLDEANAYFAESIRLYRQVDDELGLRSAIGNSGIVASRQRDYERALELLTECLSLSEASGDSWSVTTNLANLGWIYLDQGDLNSAEWHFRRSLHVAQDTGRRYSYCDPLDGWGIVVGLRDDPRWAARILSASEALRQSISFPRTDMDRDLYSEYLAQVRGRLDASIWDEAWAAGQSMQVEDLLRKQQDTANAT